MARASNMVKHRRRPGFFRTMARKLLNSLNAPPPGCRFETELQRLNSEVTDLYRAGDFDRAFELAHQALDQALRTLPPDDAELGTSLRNLVALCNQRGEGGQIESIYTRMLAKAEQRFGPVHPFVAECLNNLISYYHGLGRFDCADPLCDRWFAIMAKPLGPGSLIMHQSLRDLVTLYCENGRHARAESLYEHVIGIMKSSHGAHCFDVIHGLDELGALYNGRGKYEEAAQVYERLLAIAERPDESSRIDLSLVAHSLFRLGEICCRQRKFVRSELLLDRAMSIRLFVLNQSAAESGSPIEPDYEDAQILHGLASVYLAQGRYEQAEHFYLESLCILEQNGLSETPSVARLLKDLAALYRMVNRENDAASLENRLGGIHAHCN